MHSLRFFRLFLGVYVHRARALRAYVGSYATLDSQDYFVVTAFAGQLQCRLSILNDHMPTQTID